LVFPKKTPPPPFPKEKFDWLEISYPEFLTIGEKNEIKIDLKQDPLPGGFLQVDAHATGGFNATAGQQPIKGKGPYTFKITPNEKAGLEFLELIIFTTADGTWKGRTNLAKQKVSAKTNDNMPPPKLHSPQINTESFLIEAYLKINTESNNAIIVKKMDQTGYELKITTEGKLSFCLSGKNQNAFSVQSKININDGKYHHIIAECDRKNKKLALYIDGKTEISSNGPDGNLALENPADLFVGGTPQGNYMKGTLDFLRISQGSIADAKTTIEELYAWQFNGPQFRDFAGQKPRENRDAGAIEHINADK
jgi:hypothetical protein